MILFSFLSVCLASAGAAAGRLQGLHGSSQGLTEEGGMFEGADYFGRYDVVHVSAPSVVACLMAVEASAVANAATFKSGVCYLKNVPGCSVPADACYGSAAACDAQVVLLLPECPSPPPAATCDVRPGRDYFDRFDIGFLPVPSMEACKEEVAASPDANAAAYKDGFCYLKFVDGCNNSFDVCTEPGASCAARVLLITPSCCGSESGPEPGPCVHSFPGRDFFQRFDLKAVTASNVADCRAVLAANAAATAAAFKEGVCYMKSSTDICSARMDDCSNAPDSVCSPDTTLLLECCGDDAVDVPAASPRPAVPPNPSPASPPLDGCLLEVTGKAFPFRFQEVILDLNDYDEGTHKERCVERIRDGGEFANAATLTVGGQCIVYDMRSCVSANNLVLDCASGECEEGDYEPELLLVDTCANVESDLEGCPLDADQPVCAFDADSKTLTTCTRVIGEPDGPRTRLVGGSGSAEGDFWSGRVEVNAGGGAWGTVCDTNIYEDRFERTVATLCRFMGFQNGKIEDAQGAAQGQPILLDLLSCNGDESDIFHCGHSGVGVASCGHDEDLHLTCFNMIDKRSVRLVQGKGGPDSDLWTGKFELYTPGEWATVCDNAFGSSSSSITTVNTLCGFLGYEVGVYVEKSDDFVDAAPQQTLFYDRLLCDGTEDNVFQCFGRKDDYEDCDFSDDLHLSCFNKDTECVIEYAGAEFPAEYEADTLDVSALSLEDQSAACLEAMQAGRVYAAKVNTSGQCVMYDMVSCSIARAAFQTCADSGACATGAAEPVVLFVDICRGHQDLAGCLPMA